MRFPEDRADRAGTVKRLLAFCFFVSGIAALLDQLLWQRLIALIVGTDAHAVTIVVAAFMAGLGSGSLAGGHLADRLSGRGRIVAFGAAELALAAFTAGSPFIFYDWLYIEYGAFRWTPAATGVVLFLLLACPTFCIGLSLPLLARALADDAPRPVDWVTTLYGWNVLGGAAGVLLALGVVFRTMDVRSGLQLAAGLSAACAACAFAAAGRFSRHSSARAGDADGDSVPPAINRPANRFGLRSWLAVYAASGFVALSLELLWFRMLQVMLKPNAFIFGMLLAVYLLGMGLGALAANHRWLRARPPMAMFFRLQSGVVLYAVLSIAGLVAASGRLTIAQPLWDHFRGYGTVGLFSSLWSFASVLVGQEPVAVEREHAAALVLTLYGVLPLFLIGPPTVMMGLSFGYLQRAVQTDPGSLGRRTGWLQTANIIGSLLGVVVTGLFLLQRLGSAGTLRVIAAVGGIFLLCLARVETNTRRNTLTAMAAAVAAASLAIGVVPSFSRWWSALHGRTADEVIVEEDSTGVSLIATTGNDGPATVFANGMGESTFPYGGIHTALGAVPLLLHPSPVSALVIGLGSGDTLYAIGGRREVRAIDCVEIVAPVWSTLRTFAARHPEAGLALLLGDRRVRHISGDGRAFLARSERRYDIIEADALGPHRAMAGNLYSFEYFRLLASRLNPGGLAVSWGPTTRVRHTFVKAFPHALVLDDILIGSNDRIAFNAAALKHRLAEPFTSRYFAMAGIDVASVVGSYLEMTPSQYGPELDRAALADVNQDLFAKDEYIVRQPADILP